MSGAIAAVLLAGAGAPGVLLASMPNSSFAVSNDYQLHNDGNAISAGADFGAGVGVQAPWVRPASTTVAAYYQVKTVVTAGSFTTDPSAGSFIDLSSSRTWSKVGAGTVTFTMTIREKATGTVRATYTGIALTTT